MKHIPFGYRIVGGKAEIVKEEADVLLKVIDNFLSGMSYKKAGKIAGLHKYHRPVKQLICNPKYYNDAFYPAIIDVQTAEEIMEESRKRENNRKPKSCNKQETPVIYMDFIMKQDELSIEDPIKQAEYVYSLIESVVDEK